MADAGRAARQWLQTDQAFGVEEVPVRKAGRPVPRPPASLAVPQRPQAAAPAQAPARAPFVPSKPAPAPARPAPPLAAKSPAKAVLPPAPAGLISALPALTRDEKMAALDALRRQIEAQSAPLLSDVCTRVVFGEGDPDAAIMFVGEGPGAEEDKTGRPFVGRSGQLLDKMITAIGYKREQVFIANVVKLRCAEWTEGPGQGRLQDRPPNPEEVARGIPYLHRQIEIIRPKVVVTLGAPAVKHLTGTTEGVMKLRGKWLEYRGIPVMPTYHPSFVLRAYTEENRRNVWSDLKEAARKAT